MLRQSTVGSGGHCRAGMDGDGAMELGYPGAIHRRPFDRLSARDGPVDPEPNSVWRISRSWRLARPPALASVGTDDAGGARKFSEEHIARQRQAPGGSGMSNASTSACKQTVGVIAPVIN